MEVLVSFTLACMHSWVKFNFVVVECLAMMFASAYPDIVKKLIMIDSLGPITRSAEETGSILRKGIDSEVSMLNLPEDKRRGMKIYKSLEDAVGARMRIVKTYPGSQTISKSATVTLLRR